MHTQRALLPFTALALLAGPARAQVVHDVDVGPFFDFEPADVVIDVGDTVRWTWVGGLHDVKSGAGGIVDGIFDSGPAVVGPKTFQVTFDQAFLAANPVAGHVYGYFCAIHVSFGMEGSVTVNAPAAPVITPYGCLNPAGSLVELAGQALAGTTWTVGLDNPVPGGQPAGSLAALALAASPAPGFPCGLALPGFHMDAGQPAGEILVGLTPPDPLAVLGPVPWSGAGTPAAFALALPANPALVGVDLYVQGVILDTTFANAYGASEGWRVTVGG
jgi:plastocyanin